MIRTVFSGECYSQEVNALCITARRAMLFPRYHVILTSNPSKFTQFDPLTSTESMMKDYQFSRMQKKKAFRQDIFTSSPYSANYRNSGNTSTIEPQTTSARVC